MQPAPPDIVKYVDRLLGDQAENRDRAKGLMFRHPFTGGYTDQELAALAHYTTSQFGYRQVNVTPEQIRKQRGPEKAEKPAS